MLSYENGNNELIIDFNRSKDAESVVTQNSSGKNSRLSLSLKFHRKA